ncbi:hypothetical protein ACO1O0_004735 [Amphichorda felina]
MRFFASMLALWATCLGVASGYSMPGGYERMMFYYAYVAECKETKNNPTQIAAGCAKTPNVCSFDRFMEYILPQTNPSTKVNIHDKGHDDLPDIDSTARKLNDAGLTGAVVNGRVWRGASNNWAEVLSKVGGYIARSVDSDNIPMDVRKGMAKSMKMVYGQRMEASAISWNPEGRVVILKTVDTYGVPYQTLDAKETMERNPGWDFRTEFGIHVGEGHKNNNIALKVQLEVVKIKEAAGCFRVDGFVLI